MAVFYERDSRTNLELSIGDGNGGPSWLEDWVKNLQRDGSKVFLSGDSEFEDAILGGGLGATTAGGKKARAFTVYPLADVQILN